MRHLTFLLLALFSTTMTWAGNITTTSVTGGTIAFYSDEACATILDVTSVTAGSTVYIKATPDATHIVGAADNQGKVTFITAEVTTSAMESRRLQGFDETAPLGSFLDVWRVSDGIYRFTMPADDNLNVSVSAAFPVKTEELTSYLDAAGVQQTVMAHILTGTETTIGTANATTWYVAKTTTAAFTSGLTLQGNVNIILADGATMTVGTTGNPVSGNGLYTYVGNIGIYGQSTGSNQGRLSVVADGYGIYAKKYGDNSGAINIIYATVSATGNYGIRSENDLTISGSTVTTTGTGEYGIYALWGNTLINNDSHVISHGERCGIYVNVGDAVDRGNLTIDGSEVEAVMTSTAVQIDRAGIYTSGTILLTNAIVKAIGNRGIYTDSGVTINSGQVTATGSLYEGIYVYSGDINLGWTAATDFIRASSYGGTVNIADGQRFVAYTVNGDETETATAFVSGTVSDLTAINGKTLRPIEGYFVTIPDGVTMTATREEGGTMVSIEPVTIDSTPYYIYQAGDQVSLTVSLSEGEVITGVSYSDGTTDTPITATNGIYSFTMPANDITISVSKVQLEQLLCGTVTGGTLKFYSDADCTYNANNPEAGSTVYVQVTPSYGYTAKNVAVSVVAAISSDQAGETIAVSTVNSDYGIYCFTMPANTNAIVSAVLTAVEAVQVSYVDENQESHSVSAIPLDLTMTHLEGSQWYVASSDITFGKGFTSASNDKVCIIIPDGVTLAVGTKASPVTCAFSFGAQLNLYGQAGATGKLTINSTGAGISIGNPIVFANIDVEVTSGDSGINPGASSSTGCIIAGHPTNGNTVTVRSNGNGINTGSLALTIKYCDIDVVSSGSGIEATGYPGVTIEGLAEKGNTVKVSSNGTGISGGPCPVTIKYCDVEIISQSSNGINASGGTGVTIEGLADGSNHLTLRASSQGINTGGCAVTIKYCDVELTGVTKNQAGEYYPCGSNGIYGSGGSGITITGHAQQGNTVKVASTYTGIDGGGCPVTIKYCDVEIISQSSNGINASGGTGVTIEGLADGSNHLTLRASSQGINTGGCAVTIKYCDVELTGVTKNQAGEYYPCGSNGIYISGGGLLTITGHAENGNEVVAKSTYASFYCSGANTDISNCNLDLYCQSGRGIDVNYYGESRITSTLASGNTVKVVSMNEGIYVDGCALYLKNCNTDISNQNGNAIFSTYNLTIEGGQHTLHDAGSSPAVKCSGSGVITLGWTAATDYIYADSYEGTVRIADGQRFEVFAVDADETETSTALISGTVSDLTAINGMKLRPLVLDGFIVTIPDGVAITATREVGGTTVNVEPTIIGTIPYYIYKEGDQVSMTVTPGEEELLTGVSYHYNNTDVALTATDGIYAFTMPAYDVTIVLSKILPVVFSYAAGQQWTSWCSDTVWRLPEGLEAYTVVGVGSDAVTMDKVTVQETVDDQLMNVIPAYTPVLLYRSDATEEGSYAGRRIGEGTPGSNVSDDGVVTATAEGCTFYGTVNYLGYSAFEQYYYPQGQTTYVLRGGYFLRGSSNQGMAAHRCWLNIENTDAARLGISFGETTSIIDNGPLKIENYDGAEWYTLDGRKLDKRPTAKGIYLYGGRKTIVK